MTLDLVITKEMALVIMLLSSCALTIGIALQLGELKTSCGTAVNDLCNITCVDFKYSDGWAADTGNGIHCSCRIINTYDPAKAAWPVTN